MEPTRIERTVELPASREDVWDALTRPGRLSEWFGAEVLELDARPGGRLMFRDDVGTIRRAIVETAEPPSVLIFRWLAIEQDRGGQTRPAPGTTVEFRLAATPAGTELTVVETIGALSRV
ncbi:MAG: SRPBCC domain-containing protein [Actinomycetota bacterium]